MDIVLKDGTLINHATVEDISELVRKGIIKADVEYKTDSVFDQNEYMKDCCDTNELLDACMELCKDNDSIPPRDYSNEDGYDHNLPGMHIIRELMNNDKVVDCPPNFDNLSGVNWLKGVSGQIIDSAVGSALDMAKPNTGYCPSATTATDITW
jgi:hypothetical protein